MTGLLIKLFIKDNNNIKDFKVRELYGKFAGIVGIATNFLLFLIKITVGFLFNSISIIADAVNNLSDSGSSVVTLMGFKLSGRPADPEHPYGHARMEYISGLVVSFIVLFLGLQLIQSSFDKIIHPQTAKFSIITVFVLIASILIKLWQCLFYRKIGKIINSSVLFATSIDSRNDIIATSAVLVALIATYFTGYNFDGYMGVLVAIIIMISGVKLIGETANPLLGTAPSKELVDEIYHNILEYDGIIGMHDLAVHSYGASKCFASVHCEVPAEQDIMISHDIIDNIERDFLQNHGIHMVIHLDPIVTNDARTEALKANVKNVIKTISAEITMHDFRVVFGVSHTNLIFDVVVPFGIKQTDNELTELICNCIHDIDSNYHAIITIDHNYVPCGEQ